MPKQINITVLGDGSVGKSCVTTRYVNNEFLESYDPTIQDSFRKDEFIDGEDVVVEILDTAGQEDYVSINDSSIMHGQGFLVVYAVTAKTSFEAVDGILHRVYSLRECENSDNKPPVVLCGNKIDLQDMREVTTEEGNNYATLKGISFYETSAKTNVNISEAFLELLRKCLATSALAPSPEKTENSGGEGGKCCVIL